ncbi:MAG: cupin domain-containing protein [Solirubrobacterales bacterium]|nr:cupin domain-containing protein [Solirubrobacterales bacterium]
MQTSVSESTFLDCRARIHARGDELGLVEMLGVPAGSMPPLHVHRDHDEGFYVLAGEVTLITPDDEVTLGPGDFFLAPRGVPHTYRVGDEPAHWLCTSTPGRFADFVAAVAALPEQTPDAVGPVAAANGIDLLGPPGALPS